MPLRGHKLSVAQLALVVAPSFVLFGYNQAGVGGLLSVSSCVPLQIQTTLITELCSYPIGPRPSLRLTPPTQQVPKNLTMQLFKELSSQPSCWAPWLDL